ncbi:hypothetical protein [Patulibacter sp.]|uniref:hypothetical protein n=1 Tax=Patulibacter sp. TaxID=1912859 RepID=UPI00271E44B5|nr:hypothetical protein [Patulibacter sp.]MDO9407536.1 hypothetical protein [Patulibacter sp.]
MAPTPTRPSATAPIPLSPVDVRLLDAPPVLALLRLDRELPTEAVRAAFLAHAPRRFSAAVDESQDPAVLLPGRGAPGFATRDVQPHELDDVLGVDVPFPALAAVGLDDAPARHPLCTLVHLRVPGGDALAFRLSHAAGDGMSLLAMLGAIAGDLEGVPADGPRDRTLRVPADRSRDPDHRADTAPQQDVSNRDGARRGGDADPTGSAVRGTGTAGDARWLSVLPLSRGCLAELDAVGRERPDLSPTMRRMAVLARRIAALVHPPEAGLRVRIPVDLRHRDLGIPAAAIGNHWFDALAVLDGPQADLPAAGELADHLTAAVRAAATTFRPGDVEHRPDESLRLLRDVPVVPLRRGVDLVHSALPAPRWPGVRELVVMGSALLGVVDVRGATRVPLVTPRPLPAGVVEL